MAHGRPAGASDDASLPARRGVHATLSLLGGGDDPAPADDPRNAPPTRPAVLRIELVLDERTLREVGRAIATAAIHGAVAVPIAADDDDDDGGGGGGRVRRLDGTMTIGELRVDFGTHEVWRSGRRVPLRPREFALLRTLIRADGCAVSRECLMQEVWGYTEDVVSRTLDTHVRSLRRKLEPNPASPRHLLTVRTVGYRFAR